MEEVFKTGYKGNIKKSISEAISGLGVFPGLIKKGDKVLLKPNFNTADPFLASSDLEFLKSVAELVYEAGAREVVLGDSSTIYQRTEKVMEKMGVYSLEELDKPVRVVNFDKGKWIKKEIPGGKYLKSVSVPEVLETVNKLILLPCLKTHFIAGFTGSLKLSVGFIKPVERTFLHARNIQEKIAEMNTIINPDLIIMDGRKCFITDGPAKGELREPNLILASRSRTEIDMEGIRIIKSFPGNDLSEVSPRDFQQVKIAKNFNF